MDQLKFLIKCTHEDGFEFGACNDYSAFFPEHYVLAEGDRPTVVKATFPWGVGTFTFGAYVVQALFEYNSIDFGYTEPVIDEVAALVTERTGKPAKWYQVPNTVGKT